METITNVASTAATTVSNLIYGQPEKKNETAGEEPISGQQGKGTVNEPYDQGNAETPVNTSSTTATTEGKSENFLKLNPSMGKSATTESSTDTKAGSTTETSIPILPLNPDASTLGSNQTSTNSTGAADKTGVSDNVWKPTALDEVKPSGAPGAGPEAPSNVTPAVPEGFSGTSAKTAEAADTKAEPKESTTAPTSSDNQGSSGAHKGSVTPQVDAIIGSTPAAEHSVPDEEANDPHSKMQNKTVRNTDKSVPDTTGHAPVIDSKAEKTESNTSDSKSKSPDRANGEEKDSKMSHLKDKLKTKLHIGSKDK